MEELGYRRNALARSLRRGTSHTVGVILPDSANPFFAEIGRGVEDTTFALNYSLILCNSENDSNKERFYAGVLCEKQADGIIFVSTGESTELLNSLIARGLAVVVVDREVPDVPADTVLTDNLQGGFLATQHLIGLGHRRIGCITGPSPLRPSAQRLSGHLKALDEYGIARDPEVIARGDFQYQSGYEAAHKLLDLPRPPTAIFAHNDLMAVGAIRAAVERGLEVPRDLAVVGFDDVPLASFTNPRLTTVAQPKHELGVRAMRMLTERIQNHLLEPRREVLPTTLIVRDSCGGCA